MEIVAKDATLEANKKVLAKHSEYFDTCCKETFVESNGVVHLDDVDSKYLSFYIGLAYSYSSIVPPAAPTPAANPETSTPKQPMRDYVEVYKLCDRFLSGEMAISDGHRALYRAPVDDGLQRVLMRDFADGFEVLERDTESRRRWASR